MKYLSFWILFQPVTEISFFMSPLQKICLVNVWSFYCSLYHNATFKTVQVHLTTAKMASESYECKALSVMCKYTIKEQYEMQKSVSVCQKMRIFKYLYIN
jgi:hypothetical protein